MKKTKADIGSRHKKLEQINNSASENLNPTESKLNQKNQKNTLR